MSSDKLWAHGLTLLTWRMPFSPHSFRAGPHFEIHVLYTQWLQPPLSLVSPWQQVGAHLCVIFALGSPPELSVSSTSSKVSFSLLLVRKRTKTTGFNTCGAKKLKSCDACEERKQHSFLFFSPWSFPLTFCRVDGCYHVHFCLGLVADARVKKETMCEYENPEAGERRDLCGRRVNWCSECSSHGLSFVHASALPCISKAFTPLSLGFRKIWSEYDLREMIWSPFMVCTSAACGPAFFNKQSLVTESGRAAPEIRSGEVAQPTWPCDEADWPHDCKTMSGTWQLWPQVHNSVSGWGDWGENPEEFKKLLKRTKKPLGPLAAHWTRKKAVHVRVQVASHKRGHSVRWKIFFFLTWGTSDENCQRMSQSMT